MLLIIFFIVTFIILLFFICSIKLSSESDRAYKDDFQFISKNSDNE